MKKSKLLISAFAAMAMFFGLASCKNESDDVDVDVYTETETSNYYYYDVSGSYNSNTVYGGTNGATVQWSTYAKTNTNVTEYTITINSNCWYYDSSSSSSGESLDKSFTIRKIGSNYYYGTTNVSSTISNPESSTITIRGYLDSDYYNLTLTRK